MTKQQILEYARKSIDDAMEMGTVNDNDPHDPWIPFYLGKAWACLSIALGGEEDT